MGGETNTADRPGLKVNRHISGYAVGTCKLEKVEIIRNGSVIHTLKPKDYHCDFEYDDMEPLNKVTLNANDKKPPFIYYYLRVTQEDGNIAWSSPIWVDDVPLVPGKGRRVIKSTSKPTAAAAKIKVEEEEEEDSFDEEDEEEDIE